MMLQIANQELKFWAQNYSQPKQSEKYRNYKARWNLNRDRYAQSHLELLMSFFELQLIR